MALTILSQAACIVSHTVNAALNLCALHSLESQSPAVKTYVPKLCPKLTQVNNTVHCVPIIFQFFFSSCNSFV